MSFIFNKGCGNTENGQPYEARWKDENNNTRTRDVARPDIVAKYYDGCNIIDVHNQSRQYNLRLEKHWVTEDGFFRLMTTIIGIVITDCWKGYNHHLHDNHRHKGMELLEYTKILAKDMLDNKYPNTPTSKSAYSIMDIVPPAVVVASPTCYIDNDNNNKNNNNVSDWDNATKISTLTSSNSPSEVSSVHTLCCNNEFTSHVKIDGNERKIGKRRRRGKCIICNKNTSFYCKECEPSAKRLKIWCCNDSAGRDGQRTCLSEHQLQIISKSILQKNNLP
jgi:hypothetical protein